MNFTLANLTTNERYKLLIGTIVPRPIAWISSLNANGSVNLAPFSAFNYMGSDPALIAVSPAEGKQTLDNIRREKEFVVNIVNVALLEAMNLTATDFPVGTSELEIAALTAVPSLHIKAPRVASSPAQMECKLHSILEIGKNRIVIAEVLELHVADALIDTTKMYIDSSGLDALGRMGGAGGYSTTRDALTLGRIPYDLWLAQQKP
jgi:flavin reductase (DIM6/NTAB) family NADH-FMN oxidoreductase RutF